jgi:outer membrane receptor protein involved in Fe transport
MIRRDLLITSALALIFLVSVNRATAENGKETMGAPENKVAKQKVYKLEEVVVTAKEAERRSLPYSVDITDSKEIEASHARTLAEIVDGKPGISFETDGPANCRIGIRGLARDRLSLFLDGNRQFVVRNAGTDISIDPWDVERIEIIKGANGLSYACDTIGGIANIILKRPPVPETGWSHGQSVMNGFSSVNDEYHAGARVWVSEAKGKYAQISGTYREANTDIETGKNFAIPNSTYRITTNNIILGYGNDDTLMEVNYYGRYGRPIGTYRSKIIHDPDDRHLFAAKYKREGQGLFKSTEVKASYMRFDIDFRFFEKDLETTKKWFIGKWNNYVFEAMTNLGLSDKHDLFTGMNLYWTPVDRWQEGPDGNHQGDIFPEVSKLTYGLFLQDNISFGDRLGVSGVLRFDHNRLKYEKRKVNSQGFQQAVRLDRVRGRKKNYDYVSGNLGTNYKLTETMNLRWNVGTVGRASVPGKFSVFVPAIKKKPGRVGNPEVKEERSWSTELGFNYNTSGTGVDTTIFYTKIDDYLCEYTSKSLKDPKNKAFKYRTFANQDATLYGAELGIKQRIIQDFFSFKGTISYAVGSYDDPIPDSVSRDTDLPLIPPLRGFAALEFNPLRNMSIVWKTRYAAKQSRNSEVAGEEETAGYVVHDLAIDYIFDRVLGLRNVNLYLDIINLTNKAYKEHTVQYEGVAIGFEESYYQPGIDVRTGISFQF